MSLTITQDGKALSEEVEGISMPADYSFATVNDYVHRNDRVYEELECLCLGMACHIDKMSGRDGLMIIAAVRYCIGRMSYIVSDCVEWLIGIWPGLPERVKNIIKRDIDEAFKRDDEAREYGIQDFPLGMECDRQQWERVRNLWSQTP